VLDWPGTDSPREIKIKEAKRLQLVDLLDYISKNKSIPLSESTLVEIMKMISANAFRTLSPRQPEAEGAGEGEDEAPITEPSWPHLHLVYDFFLRFIVNTEVDPKLMKQHINGDFILRLLDLFDAEDGREREYVKTILHRIYAKFMQLRGFIRKSISNVFCTFVYETEKHNGIAELLEILGSIINGFTLPLKQEHKAFFRKVLTPMHKVRTLSTFHTQLSYCVTQLVDKDPSLVVSFVNSLIKNWPITNSSKEVLFLQEFEEVLELTPAPEFQQMIKPLFRQLSKCIGSSHFQVAERALYIWQNEYISSMIADHRHQILPIILPVLEANQQSHWNQTVANLTGSVLKVFADYDQQFLNECVRNHTATIQKEESEKNKREASWSAVELQVESTIKALPPALQPPVEDKFPP
jgi:serine/threonine-protein phosphatase 2A regulatory subunit B'